MPVVEKVDSAIHRISHYPLYNTISTLIVVLIYLVDGTRVRLELLYPGKAESAHSYKL